MTWVKSLPYILAAIVGGIMVLAFMGIKVHSLQEENLALKNSLGQCLQANAENVTTIKRQQSEIKSLMDSCQQRIILKDRVIEKVKTIDEMKGSSDAQKAANIPSATSDDIRDALLGMYPPSHS